MKYREIYDEYSLLVNNYSRLRFELQSLPKGNVVKKRISNKTYHYLQYSVYGKKKTEYIREQEVDLIKSRLLRREQLQKEVEEISTNMFRLEQAAKILDNNLSRTFYYLSQCADMDSMPISKREAALSFASAITSLEGVPAQAETDNNLKAWANGEK